MESKNVVFFNKLSFVTLLGTIFLSLFFFIPYVPVTLDATKGFLVSIGVTLALFFWLIARLGEGKFVIPNDRLIVYAAIIPFVFLIASFFSSSKYISFFGSGFEIGTFGSMLIMFILFFLSSIYFQVENRLSFFYRLFSIGATIIAVFELLNIFIGFNRFLPGLLRGISAGNLVGSWNDFALFFGLVILLSIFTLEFLKKKGWSTAMHYFLIVSGLFFLVMINIPLAWVLVGIFSIIIFVYSISVQQVDGHAPKDKHFPFTALIVVFVCLIFLVGNSSIGNLISQKISVSNPDVHLSAKATSELALKAIKHNPVFGTGPNTFVNDWALWQPKQVAQSIFWNIDFTNGYSSLLTFAVTTGIAGLIAFLLFLVVFFMRSVQSIRLILRHDVSNYFTMSTIIVSIYAWVTLILYTPNIIMFVLAFISSGMLIGILVLKKAIPTKTFSFLGDPRNSFFAILGLMVLMILTLSTSYVYAEKFASIIYFSKGSTSANNLDSLSRSEKMLSNALLLDQNDIYYRTLSQIYIAEIGLLINDKTISQDTLKATIQQRVSLAESAANGAVSQNRNQYQNYVNLGNIYTALVPLSVTNSYEGAVAAYTKAQTLAPNNPSILLSRASLEFAHKSNDQAKKFINQALELKNDYTDAIFLRAQIDTDEGDLPGAIKEAERAAGLTPNDPTVFFRLGLLRYNNNDYPGSVSAFEQAVRLDQSYLNAHYFLGLSYQKVGRSDEALKQFRLLSTVAPDNQEIKDAINSVTKGTQIQSQTPIPETTPTNSTVTPKTTTQTPKPTTKNP